MLYFCPERLLAKRCRRPQPDLRYSQDLLTHFMADVHDVPVDKTKSLLVALGANISISDASSKALDKVKRGHFGPIGRIPVFPAKGNKRKRFVANFSIPHTYLHASNHFQNYCPHSSKVSKVSKPAKSTANNNAARFQYQSQLCLDRLTVVLFT